MAKTVAEAFNHFHDHKLQLTLTQQEKVKSRRERAETFLRKAFPTAGDLPIKSVRLIGSASRQTIIRPLNDLDVLVQFENKDQIFENYRYDSQNFLYRVRNAIDAKTQVRMVGARGQAVRLFYDDGLHVDIAPVFAWSGGGYALPAGDSSWLTTDPFEQNRWLSERNKALGGHLKRKVRFLKRWNRVHSSRLGSFHLEVMVASAFASLNADTRDALKVFFQCAAGHLDCSDPAGHSGNLSSYLTHASRTAVLNSLLSAADRAERANGAELGGDHAEALRLWRIVLGEELPAYG